MVTLRWDRMVGSGMPGPLESVKIVDLCRDLAGSYACMLLGDMGAQVVKVEPVGGDPLR